MYSLLTTPCSASASSRTALANWATDHWHGPPGKQEPCGSSPCWILLRASFSSSIKILVAAVLARVREGSVKMRCRTRRSNRFQLIPTSSSHQIR
jgi:hypothetical protein